MKVEPKGIRKLRRSGWTWWQVAYIYSPPWTWLRLALAQRAGWHPPRPHQGVSLNLPRYRCSRCGKTQDKESALEFLLIHEVTCYPETAQTTVDAVNQIAAPLKDSQ